MDDLLIERLSEDTFDPLTLTQEELVAGMRRLTTANVATPVLCGSSLQNMAVQPLMDAIIRFLPGPLERTIQVYGANTSVQWILYACRSWLEK